MIVCLSGIFILKLKLYCIIKSIFSKHFIFFSISIKILICTGERIQKNLLKIKKF
jgi:hypothetical protein